MSLQETRWHESRFLHTYCVQAHACTPTVYKHTLGLPQNPVTVTMRMRLPAPSPALLPFLIFCNYVDSST